MDDDSLWFRLGVQWYYARECISEWMLARWGYERMKDNRVWRLIQF